MYRIVVDPEQLRQLSKHLSRTAHELQAVSGRAKSAGSSLDWEVRSRANVAAEIRQLEQQGASLASRLDDMARYLQRKGQTFEEADQAPLEVMAAMLIEAAIAAGGVAIGVGVAPGWVERIINNMPKILPARIIPSHEMPERPAVDKDEIRSMYEHKSWSAIFDAEKELQSRIREMRARERELAEEIAGNRRELGVLDSEEAQLLRRRRQLEEERNNLLKRVLPTWPPRPGFDDGLVDAPWRTQSDEIEDEIARIDARLEKLRARRETVYNNILQDQAALKTARRELQNAQTELEVVHEKLDRGITDHSTRQSWLMGRGKPGAMGGCTHYVATRRDVSHFGGGHPGDAYKWRRQAQEAGFETGKTPVKGAIMYFGDRRPTHTQWRDAKRHVHHFSRYGHVAYVEKVEQLPNGQYKVTVSQANTIYKKNGEFVRGAHTTPTKATYVIDPEKLPGYVGFIYDKKKT